MADALYYTYIAIPLGLVDRPTLLFSTEVYAVHVVRCIDLAS